MASSVEAGPSSENYSISLNHHHNDNDEAAFGYSYYDSDLETSETQGVHFNEAQIQSNFFPHLERMCALCDIVPFGPSSHEAQPTSEKLVEMCKTTPLFTIEVGTFVEAQLVQEKSSINPFNQYGLIGSIKDTTIDQSDFSTEGKQNSSSEGDVILANMDMPWSAFICGSQGAGKSHTLSCILENAIIDNNNSTGKLPNPMTAMVFHYDNQASKTCSQVCEAAYLCSSGVKVSVLVSPSNIWHMKRLYQNLPGVASDGPKPNVWPLYLSKDALDISSMSKLMAIDLNAESKPLYMETLTSILREMAMTGNEFSYNIFREKLDAITWAQGQKVPLNLRLQLLDSFLAPDEKTINMKPAEAPHDIWDFQPGTLTIVDLSDPFVSSADACSLFSICLPRFMESRAQCGRIIALDEAHKFLRSGVTQQLTSDLTTVIREQRHTGTRVIIATQEPTLSPELIDLANVTFVHRFLSPAWYDVLKKHLAGARKHTTAGGKDSLFETIVGLETGEALMFCPTALVAIDRSDSDAAAIKKLGADYLQVKIRNRVTVDGGKSILASQTKAIPTSPAAVDTVEMHVVEKSTQAKLTADSKGKARADSSSAVEEETRSQMRRKMRPSVWDTNEGIGWKKLAENVEMALKMKPGQIDEEFALRAVMQNTARDEVRLFRLENYGKKSKLK